MGFLATWLLELRIAKLRVGGIHHQISWTWSEDGAAAFWSALENRGALLLCERGTPAHEFSEWYLEVDEVLLGVFAEEFKCLEVRYPRRLRPVVNAILSEGFSEFDARRRVALSMSPAELPNSPPFLFRFGYESPTEWEQNQRHGTDFESSDAVWVYADSETAAIAAGLRFADRMVAEIFSTEGARLPKAWSDLGYAFWIETDPQELAGSREVDFPSFSEAVTLPGDLIPNTN